MEDIGQRPENELNRMTDLSPAEHAIIGSSCMFNGEHFNSDSFYKILRSGNVSHDVFEPLGLKSGIDIEVIKKRRRGVRSISGMLNFVEPIAQTDLALDENLYPTLFLGDSNFADNPVFKIGLQDSKGLTLRNSVSFEFLSNNLSPQYEPYFRVEQTNSGVYLVKK